MFALAQRIQRMYERKAIGLPTVLMKMLVCVCVVQIEERVAECEQKRDRTPNRKNSMKERMNELNIAVNLASILRT